MSVLANLGNPITSITDETSHGGIVLTRTNLGASNTTDSKNFTNSNGSTGWVGLSNMDGVVSDQLTIQYKNITESSLFDCEGTEVVSVRMTGLLNAILSVQTQRRMTWYWRVMLGE